MDDERVHAAGIVGEARDAVAALLGGAEFVLEERVVLGADYGEVEGHFWAGMAGFLVREKFGGWFADVDFGFGLWWGLGINSVERLQ